MDTYTGEYLNYHKYVGALVALLNEQAIVVSRTEVTKLPPTKPPKTETNTTNLLLLSFRSFRRMTVIFFVITITMTTATAFLMVGGSVVALLHEKIESIC